MIITVKEINNCSMTIGPIFIRNITKSKMKLKFMLQYTKYLNLNDSN